MTFAKSSIKRKTSASKKGGLFYVGHMRSRMESEGSRHDGEGVYAAAGRIHERINGQEAPGEKHAGSDEF
jgi:hypothetical protein